MARAPRTSQRISFYFVLYLVAIISVFVITMERDTLLKRRDEDIAHLVEIYIKPLKLSPAVDTVRYFLAAQQKATAEPPRLTAKAAGPTDKDHIRSSLVAVHQLSGSGAPPAGPQGTLENERGDGVLSYAPLSEGVYAFTVAGYKPRVIEEGKTMRVRIRDTAYTIQYSDRLAKIDRDTTTLIASVIKTGLTPTPLTLSSERARDTWVEGVPFTKKIFISGVESPERVVFDAGPLRVEKRPNDRSSIMLVWDRPSLGDHAFTIRGAGNRGLGEMDRASTSFTVNVVPATFVSPPASKAFWGIPYSFDAAIAGINPLELSVELVHDGVTAWTRPAVQREPIVPDRSWHTMALRVRYNGNLVKEHHASVEAPPPPQVRWLKQEVDRARGVLQVTVACTDPAGGPVRMSVESQPGGIARLDKIRGTTFTVTVSLEGQPGGVFLKLTATDQYGGQGSSTRQFNLQ